MILIGVVAGLVFTNINRWLGPRRPTEEKLSTYESGMEPVRNATGAVLREVLSGGDALHHL